MMIVVLYGGDLASNETARALYWSAEYKRIAADRAFGRVRRAAMLDRLARLVGLGTMNIVDEAAMDVDRSGVGRAGRAMVSIDTIVGVVDSRTGVFGPFPSFKRRWKEVWRRLWLEDDMDALPALSVLRGVDGWYLVDPPVSVLVLEVLRAKGVGEVRIEPALADRDTDIPYRENGETAPSYSLVGHARDYECCDHEESKAV